MLPNKIDLKGRVALITGASRGIGAAVAKRYAALGAHVILVARSSAELEKVDDEIKTESNGIATLAPMDLGDLDKIDQLSVAIAKRFGKLDILVGNAAMLGGLYPVTHVSDDVWKRVMTVNLEANWRLIRAFDPLLRQSDDAHAIFVTSGVTKGSFPYWGPYAISKAALEMLVRTYASEVEKTNIKVNLVDPGVVRTAMRAEAFPGENPYIHPAPEAITDIFVDLISRTLTRNGELVTAQ